MGVSHNVGDKLTFFIYCPDTEYVVLRSDTRSADPNKEGIIYKRLEKEYADIDPNIETDICDKKISDSAEVLGSNIRISSRVNENLKQNK